MKKIFSLLFLILIIKPALGANLIDVYNQAIVSDPVYQQAISQRLVTKEGVPISLAGLLPSASLVVTPNVIKNISSGPAATSRGDNTQRGYTMNLTLNQTVFDFAKFANLSGAMALSRQADAVLNAATQDLMIRVAKAYFKILEDEDNVDYIKATRVAFQQQLDQVTQQYNVGIKTVTDVYTAEASYQGSIASFIAAENQLADDRENLRVITGRLYRSLAKLSEKFPLITPHPISMETWVMTAGRQNWAIRANQFAAEAARQTIKQQFAGHLPSLNAQASYFVSHINNTGDDFIGIPPGSEQVNSLSGNLIFTIPIVQGGLVLAQTRQAQYQYQVATQKLEQTLRETLNFTRQSYLNIISGISKIKADQKTVRAAISSLEGMKAGYRVGTEILFNVLDQQQRVFQALRQYSADRYAYVNSLLELKQAAGILSQQDLVAVNHWLKEGKKLDETFLSKSLQGMDVSRVHKKKFLGKRRHLVRK